MGVGDETLLRLSFKFFKEEWIQYFQYSNFGNDYFRRNVFQQISIDANLQNIINLSVLYNISLLPLILTRMPCFFGVS